MPHLHRAIAPLSALSFALLLTGCASSSPATRIQIEYLPPPEPLLICTEAPAVPQATDQARVGEYITDLWAAGEDCRAKLKAVRQWVKDHAKS